MAKELNPVRQQDWLSIYLDSICTMNELSEITGIDRSSINKYLNCDRIPRGENQKKMEAAMMQLKEQPRIKYHPSYGYATEDQISQLKTLGFGPTRDAILRQVEFQTKNKGKQK